MTSRLFFLFITISQIACAQTLQQKDNQPYLFIDSLFTKENFTVEILDFEYPKDIQEIVLRFQNSMAEKKEWIEEYFSKNYKPGEGLPYHENFGITKEEYHKIKDLQNAPPKVIVKSTALIKVNRTSNILSFEAIEDEARFFESLQVDLKNNTLIFLNDTIPFSKEINTLAPNSFGKWHGYSWKKEISNLGDKDDLKMDSLVSKIVEINFGKLQVTNKILFRLKYKEINKGVVKANFDVACYLN